MGRPEDVPGGPLSSAHWPGQEASMFFNDVSSDCCPAVHWVRFDHSVPEPTDPGIRSEASNPKVLTADTAFCASDWNGVAYAEVGKVLCAERCALHSVA